MTSEAEEGSARPIRTASWARVLSGVSFAQDHLTTVCDFKRLSLTSSAQPSTSIVEVQPAFCAAVTKGKPAFSIADKGAHHCTTRFAPKAESTAERKPSNAGVEARVDGNDTDSAVTAVATGEDIVSEEPLSKAVRTAATEVSVALE